MRSTIVAIIFVIVLVGGVWLFAGRQPGPSGDVGGASVMPISNVSIVEGKQIVEIKAKGGYLPRKSTATAGMPTVIRFNTNGSYDCSIAVRIPSLKIAKNLPPTGATDIDIGTQPAGTLKGSCGMGMYPFEIEFTG